MVVVVESVHDEGEVWVYATEKGRKEEASKEGSKEARKERVCVKEGRKEGRKERDGHQ